MFRRRRRRYKNAGDLRWADLVHDPIWEFVDDEPVHDETVVAPGSERSLRAKVFDGVVRATLTAPGGRKFNGAVWVTFTPSMFERDAEIWMDEPADEARLGPLPEGWNSIIFRGVDRYGFELPWPQVMSDHEVQRLLRLVYAALDVRPEQLWPLRVRPDFALPDGTTEFLQHGWLRPALEDGVREVLR